MKTLDISRPVRLRNPQQGEENLVYKVTNLNEVTNRCYIELGSPLPGLNMNLAPRELVSITEIKNAE